MQYRVLVVKEIFNALDPSYNTVLQKELLLYLRNYSEILILIFIIFYILLSFSQSMTTILIYLYNIFYDITQQ